MKYIFRDFAESLELSISELALSFCLSTPNISYVIPGMLSSKNIKSNIKTSQNISLSSNQLSQLYEIYKKHDFRLKSSNS